MLKSSDRKCEQSEIKRATIVGTNVGVPLGVAVFALVGFVLWKRGKYKKLEEVKKQEGETHTQEPLREL